jgi:hypothetical protein
MTPRKRRPRLASFDRSRPDAPAPEVYSPCESDAPTDRAPATRDFVAAVIVPYSVTAHPALQGSHVLNGHS